MATGRYDAQADCYALGITLLQVLAPLPIRRRTPSARSPVLMLSSRAQAHHVLRLGITCSGCHHVLRLGITCGAPSMCFCDGFAGAGLPAASDVPTTRHVA